MRNTYTLGISTPTLVESHGVSWVLRRQQISCRRWPKLGEAVTVLTAPTGFDRKLLTYRDFHLLDGADEAGPPLISAVSEWLLMDVRSRRVRPIPPHIAALSEHLAPATAHLERPSGQLHPPGEGAQQRDILLRYGMLDFNDHLTNPVFPELMLEPLGRDFLITHLPVEIDIAFQTEARYDELVSALADLDEAGRGRHELRRGEEVLATMESRWRSLTD